MNLMLDTFALIELFKGDAKGKKVKKLLQKKNDIYISVLSIFELGTVLEKQIGQKRVEEYLRSIQTYYHIVDLDSEIASSAIELRRNFNLPAVDCLIYSSARLTKAKVVSGCKHFKSISNQKDVIIV
jgi:predicted nucleic acid-binding protein